MSTTATPENATLPIAARQLRAPLAITGLFVIAVGYTLHFAADILVPIALAMLFNLLFTPAVRKLQRVGIPAPITAGVIVAGLVGILILSVSVLSEPAEQWLRDAPTSIRDAERQLLSSNDQIANIKELANQVDDLSTVDNEQRGRSIVVKKPGILENLIGGLPYLLASTSIVVFLTFFLLASSDRLLRRLTRFGRTWTEKRRVVEVSRQIQNDVSRYLAAVTLINCGLGLLVAIAMYWLEVPNPLLWGAMVALFNFAPYLGASASALTLTFVGLTTFSTLSDALAVPGVFLILTILEGQLITPAIVGQRLALSPTVVFLAVVVWGSLWGILGALMAVPIVTAFKVICDHEPRLYPVGALLRGTPARRSLPGGQTATGTSGDTLDTNAT